MADNSSLLSASIQYGIVARSQLLTGKIMKGYLTSSSPLLGIGNPNVDFSPHVSCIAIGSMASPQAACVLWGFRSGEIASTMAQRVMMDGARAQTRYVRCRVEDEHQKPVTEIASVQPGVWLSGDSGGIVKMWEVDTKRIRCLWTSGAREPSTELGACVKLSAHLGQSSSNVIVAAFDKGFISFWRDINLDQLLSNEESTQAKSLESIVAIPPPESSDPAALITSQLSIDPGSNPSSVRILVGHGVGLVNHFHAVLFSSAAPGATTTVKFHDGPLGPITALAPCWATDESETAFIVAGDALGRVCVWPWLEEEFQHGEVKSVKQFEAHEDGAVTAIAMNSLIIATGSSRGTLSLHSALTLENVRNFSAQHPVYRPGWRDPISQIVIRDETLVWSVGAKVCCWRTGTLGKDVKSRAKGKAKYSGKGPSKGLDNKELKIDISESQRIVDTERKRVAIDYGRHREHNQALNTLGLEESEVLEYVLMLSRDEHESQHSQSTTNDVDASGEFEDGLVFGDDDSDHTRTPTPVPSPTASTVGSYNPSSRLSSSVTSSSSFGSAARSSDVRVAKSDSNQKVQVSPRLRPEPTEAGPSFAASPLSLDSHPWRDAVAGTLGRDDIFPPVKAVGPGSPRNSAGISKPSVWGSVGRERRSAQRGPELQASASPGRSLLTETLARHQIQAHTTQSTAPANPNPPQNSSNPTTTSEIEEQEDLELKFAMELSLAEARSRGEA
ncbi:hypothetical protein SISNIDRAFT_457905 [Sistotremastrum niveocremeum HHB9708]|uniref:WD40 repeat-like protein n=1 Tax=Sistotremastrum niveocremeum HHB9708 TaxID=1314777 RepID=A0A164R9K0_9AGAM|nr:hypothetical protein SISNIDRAFT_457905 [Sistotremastrum niveocremeum HHB9708]